MLACSNGLDGREAVYLRHLHICKDNVESALIRFVLPEHPYQLTTVIHDGHLMPRLL